MEYQNWTLMLKGDKNALANIYFKYAEVLYQYGLKITKDRTCVEDAIQDLFLNIIKNKKRLTTPDNIKFYIIRAYRNQLLKELIKKKPYEDISSYEVIDFMVESTLEKEKMQLPIEQQKLIKELMTALSARQKEVIYLKYKNGLTNEEIAIVMGISDQACRNLVYNAIKRMRKYYGEAPFSKEIIIFFYFFIEK